MDPQMLLMHEYIYNHYFFLDFSYNFPIICYNFIVESDLMKGVTRKTSRDISVFILNSFLKTGLTHLTHIVKFFHGFQSRPPLTTAPTVHKQRYNTTTQLRTTQRQRV